MEHPSSQPLDEATTSIVEFSERSNESEKELHRFPEESVYQYPSRSTLSIVEFSARSNENSELRNPLSNPPSSSSGKCYIEFSEREITDESSSAKEAVPRSEKAVNRSPKDPRSRPSIRLNNTDVFIRATITFGTSHDGTI